MVIVAVDSRVGCLVAQIPNVSGHRNGRELFNVTQRSRLRERFAQDRVSRLGGHDPEMVPVFSVDAEQLTALPSSVIQNYIDAVVAAAPSWRNEVTLRSIEHMTEFEPAGWAPYISPTPMMMIVGSDDQLTFPELQLEVFNLAREPKRLVVHSGGHFETYTTHFEQTSSAAVSWFAANL